MFALNMARLRILELRTGSLVVSSDKDCSASRSAFSCRRYFRQTGGICFLLKLEVGKDFGELGIATQSPLGQGMASKMEPSEN